MNERKELPMYLTLLFILGGAIIVFFAVGRILHWW